MSDSMLPVICVLVGFLACHFIPQGEMVQRLFKTGSTDTSDNTCFILFQRLLGVFFYGFIPLLVISITGIAPAAVGFNFNQPFFFIVTGIAMGAILLLMNFLNRKNPVNLLMYPQIRKKEWTTSLLALSALSWLTYLFAYEFLFRGYLLFSMTDSFGPWNAIVLNIVLYSLVHVPKGWKESIGSLPLGFLFCVVGLRAGNIWPAFIAHSFLALSNEWFALAANPAIIIIKKGSKTT